MNLNKVELAFIDNLREKGKTWQEVGITFGMSDEGIRSLYRRSPRSAVDPDAKPIAATLEAILTRLNNIEAKLAKQEYEAIWGPTQT